MKGKIKIACLPVAGIGNPYQFLMMEGLNKSASLHVFHGSSNRFIGILITLITHRPRYIHFDWIESLYARRNAVLQLINTQMFLVQLWLAKKIFKVKIVCTLHNIAPHHEHNNEFHRKIYSIFLKHASWIRVFCEETASEASNIYKIPFSKFKVIPEGDYTQYYTNTASKATSREILEIGEDKKVILFFGNIRPYKGIKELVTTFNVIDNTGCLLLIAGNPMDKTYAAEISSLATDNIRCDLRFIPKDEVQFFFNASDIVILPFIHVTNSGSAILAMGFSKPVIAPAMGSLKIRLQEQQEFLFEEGQLRSALEKSIATSNEVLEELGLRNKISLQKHTWENFSSPFLSRE